MAVWTHQPEILTQIVVRVSVYVIDMQDEGASQPGVSNPTNGALGRDTNFYECPPQEVSLRARQRGISQDQDLVSRHAYLSLATPACPAEEVRSVEPTATDPLADVEVGSTSRLDA